MRDAPLASGRHAFTVEPPGGARLDLVVAERLAISRTQAATLIAGGRVQVDGRAQRASFRAEPGASVEVDVPPPVGREIVPEAIPLVVAFEDDDLAVIDKPAGMVVHPAPGNWSGTLMNALLGRGGAGDAAAMPRAGLVHRLDKDTSGLLLVAKHEAAHRRLAADLAARRIARRYAALVWGHLDADRERVDAPIARDPNNRQRMAVVRPRRGSGGGDGEPAARGRRAVTDFVRIARFAETDLLRAHLQTGRTHQIRVHLASRGHAVVGDATYGHGDRRLDSTRSPRQFLHAAWLRFRHPVTQVVCEVRSELPADIRPVLAAAARNPALANDAAPLETLGFFRDEG